jgi:hypothetical protein
VLPVLVERCRADRVQLATGKHRLQHVRGVHRPFGRARAYHRVQLVDEEDDLPLCVRDLFQHGLEPLLELTAILRAGDERAHVERDDFLVLEPFRHVLPDDPLRQPFDDGGFADAGLADEDRVVLGAAGQDLDDPPDLVVPPDDRIELALARELRQVAPVTLKRLVGGLWILRRDALRAAHGGHRLEDRVSRDPVLFEHARGGRAPPFAGNRHEEMFGADVVVFQPLGFLFGRIGHLPEPR